MKHTKCGGFVQLICTIDLDCLLHESTSKLIMLQLIVSGYY